MNCDSIFYRAASRCAILALVLTGCASTKLPAPTTQSTRTEPFILGADMTWIPEDEADGAVYYDQGVKKDPFAIMKEHGFNYIRIRVFVNPSARGGYAARRNEAFGDLPHALALAKRVKAQGMKILLDVMYSDTWADPEHQNKPAAWADLAFDQLVQKVREHTRDVVSALVTQGTPPDIVQVGNEITHGMLWPDARVISLIPSGNAATDERMREAGLPGLGNYDNFATILKAAIEEIRAIDPHIRVALHNHLGRANDRVQEWLENLTSRGVKFDVLGFSCYAQGREGDWQRTFAEVHKKYPALDIAAFEYSARKEYVNDLIYAIPGDRGIGTFIWEPTRHREALFDKNGKNAGGGQASNFVEGYDINQGATLGPTSQPATRQAVRAASRPTTGPTSRPRRNNGGRYDANDFFKLYPEMAKRYGVG